MKNMRFETFTNRHLTRLFCILSVLLISLSLSSCKENNKIEVEIPKVNPEKIEEFKLITDEYFGSLYSDAEKRIILDMKTSEPEGVVINFKNTAGYKIYKYENNEFTLCESSAANPSPYKDIPEKFNIYYEGPLEYYYYEGGNYFSHTISETKSINYADVK